MLIELQNKDQKIIKIEDQRNYFEENLNKFKFLSEKNIESNDTLTKKMLLQDKLSKYRDFEEKIAEFNEKIQKQDLLFQGKAEELAYYIEKNNILKSRIKELEAKISNLASEKYNFEEIKAENTKYLSLMNTISKEKSFLLA